MEAHIHNFQLRRLAAADPATDAAALFLAESFGQHALFEHAFPDSGARAFALRALFRAIVEDAARHGRVEAAFSDELAGVLLWYPPGHYPMTLARELAGLRSWLQIAARAPLGLFRLSRLQATLDSLRPKAPHCHGYFLAARASARIGFVLARRMLDEADARGWPTYLETQDPRTVSLYLRLGFHIVDSVDAAGTPTWTMWRRPLACAAAPAPAGLGKARARRIDEKPLMPNPA
ncbi:MAG: hypothetical protein ACR652_01995 [Methylocystis sp.]|uniref:hypothetical protein n=1 Tax=Methylocystis sp. TaxID=1911079 RepID=UPI003DA1EA3E